MVLRFFRESNAIPPNAKVVVHSELGAKQTSPRLSQADKEAFRFGIVG